MENAPARLLAEFVGTFALIFIGAGSIMTAAQLTGGGYALIGIAAAHGFVIAVMVSALGHISGGHFNPAVSTALLITRKIKPVDWAAYVVVQLVGATVGRKEQGDDSTRLRTGPTDVRAGRLTARARDSSSRDESASSRNCTKGPGSFCAVSVTRLHRACAAAPARTTPTSDSRRATTSFRRPQRLRRGRARTADRTNG